MLEPVKNLQKSPKKVVMQQLVMMLLLVKNLQKSLQKGKMQQLRMGMPQMPEEMHQQHLLLEGEGLEEETPKTETPYSNLASVTLYLFWRPRILSTNFSSLSCAFSAAFSSCFMFSPTASSSSSISFSFFSAISALSRVFFSSASCTPSFLDISSRFCSLSTAILTVDLKFLSSSSRVTSLFMQVLSTTFTDFKTVSAALDVRASLVIVLQRVSADFLSSSSMSMILRVRAPTSDSTSLNVLSAS